jgi:hypothetical protein
MDTLSLADLDFDTLAEHLVAMAQRARKLAAEGAVVGLHDLLQQVRQSASAAGGERLALLDVAEAFLRALARSDLGRSEIALRRLFAEHSELAEGLFTRLLKPASITEEDLFEIAGDARGDLETLIELGVLRRNGKALDLRPSMRSIARDLLEPAAFRMWRHVRNARVHTAQARMKPPVAAGYLSAQLGVTQQQAASHLGAHPLLRSVRPVSTSTAREHPRVALTAIGRQRPSTERAASTDGIEIPPEMLNHVLSLVAGRQQGARETSMVSGSSQHPQMVTAVETYGGASENERGLS